MIFKMREVSHILGAAAVIIEAPSPVQIGTDHVTVMCRAANGGNLNYVNSFQISRNNSAGFALLVTVTYDRTTMSSKIHWQDIGLETR